MNKSIISISKECYLNKRAEVQKITDRIEQRQQQIERLKKKRINKFAENHWTIDLVKPILEEVKKQYPNIVWSDSDKDFVTFGLNCQCPMFGKMDGISYGIAFQPGNLDDGELFFENGKRHNPNFKGLDCNGSNNITEKITDMQQLYDHIEAQIKVGGYDNLFKQ